MNLLRPLVLVGLILLVPASASASTVAIDGSVLMITGCVLSGGALCDAPTRIEISAGARDDTVRNCETTRRS